MTEDATPAEGLTAQVDIFRADVHEFEVVMTRLRGYMADLEREWRRENALKEAHNPTRSAELDARCLAECGTVRRLTQRQEDANEKTSEDTRRLLELLSHHVRLADSMLGSFREVWQELTDVRSDKDALLVLLDQESSRRIREREEYMNASKMHLRRLVERRRNTLPRTAMYRPYRIVLWLFVAIALVVLIASIASPALVPN